MEGLFHIFLSESCFDHFFGDGNIFVSAKDSVGGLNRDAMGSDSDGGGMVYPLELVLCSSSSKFTVNIASDSLL